jgi:hypothetical protein
MSSEVEQVSEAFYSLVKSVKDDVKLLSESKLDEATLLETARATALAVSRLADLVCVCLFVCLFV